MGLEGHVAGAAHLREAEERTVSLLCGAVMHISQHEERTHSLCSCDAHFTTEKAGGCRSSPSFLQQPTSESALPIDTLTTLRQ